MIIPASNTNFSYYWFCYPNCIHTYLHLVLQWILRTCSWPPCIKICIRSCKEQRTLTMILRNCPYIYTAKEPFAVAGHLLESNVPRILWHQQFLNRTTVTNNRYSERPAVCGWFWQCRVKNSHGSPQPVALANASSRTQRRRPKRRVVPLGPLFEGCAVATDETETNRVFH